MPPTLDVNWEAVQTLAVAVGLKAASDQTGVPYAAIRQRSSREGWFRLNPVVTAAVTRKKADPYKSGSDTAVTGAVLSPPEAMQQHMLSLSGKTRLSLAVTADKLASHFSGQDPEDLVGQTPAIKDTASIAEKAHGWNKTDQSSQALVQINIAHGSTQTAPVIDLEGL
jgi:hypothetical protein